MLFFFFLKSVLSNNMKVALARLILAAAPELL